MHLYDTIRYDTKPLLLYFVFNLFQHVERIKQKQNIKFGLQSESNAQILTLAEICCLPIYPL